MTIDDREMILWIGPLLDEPELEDMIQHGEAVTTSANLAEWNFLKFLARETDNHLFVLSAIRTIEYPKNRRLRYGDRDDESFLDGKLTLRNVGFCNVFGVSHLARARSLEKEARRLAGDISSDTHVQILVYSMHLPFMKAARAFKRAHPNSCYKLIVPDLPLNMNTSTKLRKVLKNMDWRHIQEQKQYVDGYVLYTRQMAEYLELSPEDYIVCEGIANLDILDSPSHSETYVDGGERVCIYAGNLDKKYRIENLVHAFGSLGFADARLDVYGRGSGEDVVRGACEEYPNTFFHGFKPNAEIVDAERMATLIVNPRPVDIDCAEYSCPSKTLEAMSLGTPLLTTRLPGIPEDFFKHVYVLDASSLETLTASLESAMDRDIESLKRMGENARSFIRSRSFDAVRLLRGFKNVD